jgi:hypothetical protein
MGICNEVNDEKKSSDGDTVGLLGLGGGPGSVLEILLVLLLSYMFMIFS